MAVSPVGGAAFCMGTAPDRRDRAQPLCIRVAFTSIAPPLPFWPRPIELDCACRGSEGSCFDSTPLPRGASRAGGGGILGVGGRPRAGNQACSTCRCQDCGASVVGPLPDWFEVSVAGAVGATSIEGGLGWGVCKHVTSQGRIHTHIWSRKGNASDRGGGGGGGGAAAAGRANGTTRKCLLPFLQLARGVLAVGVGCALAGSSKGGTAQGYTWHVINWMTHAIGAHIPTHTHMHRDRGSTIDERRQQQHQAALAAFQQPRPTPISNLRRANRRLS